MDRGRRGERLMNVKREKECLDRKRKECADRNHREGRRRGRGVEIEKDNKHVSKEGGCLFKIERKEDKQMVFFR